MMSLLAILFPVLKYVAMTIFVLLAVVFFFTPEILLIAALVG